MDRKWPGASNFCPGCHVSPAGQKLARAASSFVIIVHLLLDRYSCEAVLLHSSNPARPSAASITHTGISKYIAKHQQRSACRPHRPPGAAWRFPWLAGHARPLQVTARARTKHPGACQLRGAPPRCPWLPARPARPRPFDLRRHLAATLPCRPPRLPATPAGCRHTHAAAAAGP